ncbi:MAG TPA: hypothetical protein VN999_06000 [Thermoanaerobaculia bacterium]|nr:hypothetical protein [Thermoanaerobaculia bacterium]
MQEFKGSPEEFSTHSSGRRLSYLKWWFIVLLVLGLAAAAATLIREFIPPKAAPGPQGFQVVPLGSGDLPLAALALAGVDSGEHNNQGSTVDPKQYILGGVLLLIAMVTLLSLLATFFSRNPQTVTTASDTLKTCLGFWIGSATKFL